MFGKKGFGKVHQIGNGSIGGICPPTGKLKTVAAFFAFFGSRFTAFFNVPGTGGIAVILGMRAVGDNKQLHKLKQPAICPKALTGVTVNLVKCLGNRHPSAF